jgi:RNA polymerase sigma-32 factor
MAIYPVLSIDRGHHSLGTIDASVVHRLRRKGMAFIDRGGAEQASRKIIRDSMNAPLLTREHELQLARAWRNDGDEAALHELIKAYMRLVVSAASRFKNYGLPMSDLIQEGVVGLMQAAARFEPERDVRFSTYAAWWIRSAMQDYILRNWSVVRTGTTAAQKSLFFNLRRLRAKIDDGLGSAMSDAGRASIAEALAVNVEDVASMEMRLSGGDQSLNATISQTGEDVWQDFLADERPSPEEVVGDRHDSKARAAWLRESLEELNERERTIIHERRLREDGRTLEELGRRLGISKERVRQIEHRALQKLKVALLRKVKDPGDEMLLTAVPA